MNTLMHICCAPCANRPIDLLRSEGLSVAGFWFNPNIHPYTEYQARKHTLEEYSKEIGMKLIIGGSYDLRTFITNVADNIDGRCAYCYRVRMEETARYAAENGYDSFTTSLLISPYQNHEAIQAAGVTADMSNEEICDALIAAMGDLSIVGLTSAGSEMTWDDNGAVSKDPAAVIIENGTYVTP